MARGGERGGERSAGAKGEGGEVPAPAEGAAPGPRGGGERVGRRAFLRLGGSAALLAGAAGGGLRALAGPGSAAAKGGAARPEAPRAPGRPMSGYGEPAPAEGGVRRSVWEIYGELAPGTGTSMTPLERLAGTVTPNGLHFERHHNGVPALDPASHTLLVHGRVERSRVLSVEDLLRLPTTTRLCFLECSGNSLFGTFDEPVRESCGHLHGLLSQAEWTGVPLRLLLEAVGLRSGAAWVVAEGADAALYHRSIPLEKCRDDAMIALYQNGERLRPEQGYPMRLLLPGWEGSTSVKWLRRLEVTDRPVMARDETSHYTDALPDGRARQFSFEMGVKSVITRPSPGGVPARPGPGEIAGLAWSGRGRVSAVEVTTDGGRSWRPAELEGPVLPRALTRFRLPWRWSGKPVRIASRARDEGGAEQPGREAWKARYGAGQIYHYNAVQIWQVGEDGRAENVHGFG